MTREKANARRFGLFHCTAKFLPMGDQGSRVALLLQEILRSPTSPASEQLERFIETENGLADLTENLRTGNALAYIFLKQNMRRWVNESSHAALYTSDYIYFLVRSSTRATRYYVTDIAALLSEQWLISSSLCDRLIEDGAFDVLEGVTRKYTVAPRSNELYSEIGRMIEAMRGVLDRVYFEEWTKAAIEIHSTGNAENNSIIPLLCQSNPLLGSHDLLLVLYNLLYQDIHPYFEDNLEFFFKLFYALFEEEALRETVLKIYDLFATKYQDCADFSSIMRSLARADSLDFEVMSVVTKAFAYRPVEPGIVIAMLRRVLAVSLDEDDMEMYTRNVLQGIDTNRGCTHRLIRQLFLVYKDELVRAFAGEAALFVATVLKFRDDALINEAQQVIHSSDDQTLIFSAFLYLITIASCAIPAPGDAYARLLAKHLDSPCRFICIKYLSASLRASDNFFKAKLLKGVIPFHIETAGLYTLLISSLHTHVDEFAAELLFRVLKAESAEYASGKGTNRNEYSASDTRKFSYDRQEESSYPPVWSSLYNFISELFLKIEKIASGPVNFLFDCFILLSIKLRRYDLKIIEFIINNDLSDLFIPCFLFLSILVKETEISQTIIMNILGQDALWAEPAFHFSLLLLLTAAHARGVVPDAHVLRVAGCLPLFPATILLCCTRLSAPSADPQARYIIDGALDAEWFASNFMDKRFVRPVIRRLVEDNRISDETRENIINKNLRYIEYETTMHSVTEYFSI